MIIIKFTRFHFRELAPLIILDSLFFQFYSVASKSYKIVLLCMLQLPKVAIPRKRSPVLAMYRFTYHQRNRK